MTGMCPCVLDYGAALDIEPCEPCCEEEPSQYQPLKPEYFDPYDPLLKHYRLSIGEPLEISVFGEEDTYYESAIVAPDGRLYYAFLDGVPADGKTVEEITKEIEQALSKYFKNPKVAINIKAPTTLTWKILGKVQSPGIYPFLEPITLRQAIGQAGGLSTEGYEYKAQNSDLDVLADLENSFLIRDNKKLDIDFQQLIRSPSIRDDIFLKPGDYIYIAQYDYREIYVLGNVRSAGRYQYLQEMTLMQALSTAGGWTLVGPYASDTSNCLVIRGELENPRFVKCNLNEIVKGEAKDFYLVPGDIIYVHNKPFRFARELVRLAMDTFVQSFATAAGSYYSQFKWFFVNSVEDD